MEEIVEDNQLSTARGEDKEEEPGIVEPPAQKKAWPEIRNESKTASPRADTQGPLKRATLVPKYATRRSSVGKTNLDDSYSDSGYADDDLEDDEAKPENKYPGKTIC